MQGPSMFPSGFSSFIPRQRTVFEDKILRRWFLRLEKPQGTRCGRMLNTKNVLKVGNHRIAVSQGALFVLCFCQPLKYQGQRAYTSRNVSQNYWRYISASAFEISYAVFATRVAPHTCIVCCIIARMFSTRWEYNFSWLSNDQEYDKFLNRSVRFNKQSSLKYTRGNNKINIIDHKHGLPL